MSAEWLRRYAKSTNSVLSRAHLGLLMFFVLNFLVLEDYIFHVVA